MTICLCVCGLSVYPLAAVMEYRCGCGRWFMTWFVIESRVTFYVKLAYIERTGLSPPPPIPSRRADAPVPARRAAGPER